MRLSTRRRRFLLLEGVGVRLQAWEADAACVDVGGARKAGRSRLSL